MASEVDGNYGALAYIDVDVDQRFCQSTNNHVVTITTLWLDIAVDPALNCTPIPCKQ